MDHHSTVLVIGGGVVGSAIALEAAKLGMNTTILEKGAFSSESTLASAGMICPQAVLFDSEAPIDLMRETESIYPEWIKELEEMSQIPVQYVGNGMIRGVYEESEKKKAKEVLAKTDGSVAWLSAEKIRKMEPDIHPNVLGGLLFPADGHLHPVSLVKSLRAALQRVGCSIKQWMPALNLITNQNRVVGVQTSEGNFYADYTIIAGGAWSSALMKQIGIDLPVYPVKGQMFAARSSTVSIKRIIQGPNGMVIPRLDGTLTVGATHENKGYDKVSDLSGISQVYQWATKLIPQLKDAEFLKAWSGLRPGTPDGLPYIGAINGVEGLLVAAGHNGIGILLAPITGRIIKEIVNNERVSVDLNPFYPERFQDKR